MDNSNNIQLNSIVFPETTSLQNGNNIPTNMPENIPGIKNIDNINYITLEIMANSDTYSKYLKKNNLDHDAVLRRDKKFYKKRIISMVKDILNNTVNNNSDSPIDDIVINAFNSFSRLCISHFKFKDTMDNIQGDYKGMDLKNGLNEGLGLDSTIDEGINGIEDNINTINEANKLFMKQVDKKIITMDNFVIKTSPPPEDEMIIPKTKDFNLKDPKYKKKDIKKSDRNHMKGKNSSENFDIKLSKIE
jgi:hypothetical protein